VKDLKWRRGSPIVLSKGKKSICYGAKSTGILTTEIHRVKKRGKSVPIQTKKAYMKDRGTPPVFFNLSNR
jgi:hypothetical protein